MCSLSWDFFLLPHYDSNSNWPIVPLGVGGDVLHLAISALSAVFCLTPIEIPNFYGRLHPSPQERGDREASGI